MTDKNKFKGHKFSQVGNNLSALLQYHNNNMSLFIIIHNMAHDR